MIEALQQSIWAILETAKSPVVAWSGGKDSMLLLYLTRMANPDIPIVWFRQNVSKKWRQWCESIIMDWDLTVYSYLASDSYYLPNDQGLTLVDEYSFGGGVMPILQDASGGSECAVKISPERLTAFSYPWAETLMGYKETDRHFVPGKGFFPEDGTPNGTTKLYAPMRTWTDDDVVKANRELGLPQSPSDDTLHRCTNCLQPGKGEVFCPETGGIIPRFSWDPAKALGAFRARFVPNFQAAD